MRKHQAAMTCAVTSMLCSALIGILTRNPNTVEFSMPVSFILGWCVGWFIGKN